MYDYSVKAYVASLKLYNRMRHCKHACRRDIDAHKHWSEQIINVSLILKVTAVMLSSLAFALPSRAPHRGTLQGTKVDLRPRMGLSPERSCAQSVFKAGCASGWTFPQVYLSSVSSSCYKDARRSGSRQAYKDQPGHRRDYPMS
jgi:hypothetical protein